MQFNASPKQHPAIVAARANVAVAYQKMEDAYAVECGLSRLLGTIEGGGWNAYWAAKYAVQNGAVTEAIAANGLKAVAVFVAAEHKKAVAAFIAAEKEFEKAHTALLLMPNG